MERSLKRPSGEQPHRSPDRPKRPECNTQTARFLDRAVVLPERQENGKEDADDAVEARGGLLRLMVEMGKSPVCRRRANLMLVSEPLKQQFL